MPTASDFDPTFPPVNVHAYFGALSIGGSCAYVLFGISTSQIAWYFRSYTQDPPIFKAFIGLLFAIDSLNLFYTVYYLYYLLIQRGVGMDPNRFIACAHWSLHAVLVLTEICCALVELFFILRMWRFAEKKSFAILAFIPYIISTVFNISKPDRILSILFLSSGSSEVYVQGMFKTPCFPQTIVNRIWLWLAYGFKILSDGIIAATMSWLFYHRSRGILERGGTIRVIRGLIYWTLSTGLILWVSTLTHLLSYTFLARETLVPIATYLTRGRIYLIALLAVVNNRQRYREAIQTPENISLRLATTQRENELEDGLATVTFSKDTARTSIELDGTGTQR